MPINSAPPQSVRAAAVQMVASDALSNNLASAAELIREAVAQGATLVVLPENFALMGRTSQATLGIAEVDGAGPIQTFLAQTAAQHGITLVGGSLPLIAEVAERACAACLVYGPTGERLARYDKRHLFDVELPDGEGYQESSTFTPGQSVVVAQTPAGRLGLSICYDLRFPEHFRALIDQQAWIILAPSAFTATTGAAHWATLVRARAIENLCYVIAPNQGGRHANGRQTYGQSMIVDPWGEVIAECPVIGGPGIACATLESAYLQTLRTRLPALNHRRTAPE